MPRVERAHGSPSTRSTRSSSEAPRRNDGVPARPQGPRGADGFHTPVLPAPSGSIEVSRSGAVSVAGKSGVEGLVLLARMIENGATPFRGTSAAQQDQLYRWASRSLGVADSGKPTGARVLERSAAATVLLGLASASGGELREKALTDYVGAMSREGVVGLKMSMMVNLEASHLSLLGDDLVKAASVREQLLPKQPPYEEWFKGRKSTLNVRHYVMDEFWKSELAAYKQRGFTIVEQKDGKVELEKELRDPLGNERPIKAKVTMVKDHENVLRDMADPEAQMVVYSGHAQLGGVVEASLARAPKEMAGTKLLQLYSCRGKQTAGDLLSRYPGVHLTTTSSSAYGEDDKDVLNMTYETIARRGSYADLYRGLHSGEMIQPRSNYILPHDARILASRDEDRDGLKDLTPLGPDKFYDPARALASGGVKDLTPRANARDPQLISGEKLDHAVGYANTAFFYFSEENRAAPISNKESDRFVAAGWFRSDSDEPVRIEEVRREGNTYFKVSVNSRYADQSQASIAMMTLMEMQKYLSVRDHGRFSDADKLRGLVLAGGYVDMMVEYADDCERLLKAFGDRYGISGATYDVVFKASLKDGHSTATPAALEYLKKHVALTG